jgi:Secretion system C-terminal sorting domain
MPMPGFFTATPDLFNVCSGAGSNVFVPLNAHGTQAPNTGSGYAGIYSGDTGPNLREGIIQDILPTGGYLTAGKVYFAEMFASLSETSNIATTMGFILTDGTSSFSYQSYWHPTNITSKTTWTRINTCFTATGNEAHIWISANGSTLTSVPVPLTPGYTFTGALPFDFAYYYIDDVSIKPLAEAGADQTICNLTTTIGNVGCPPLFGVTNSWAVSGPGAVTISSPTSPVTNVSFTTAGTYTFTLTSTDGTCTATDVVVVTVAPVPTLASASPSTICVSGSSMLTASGATSYSWFGGPATATYTVNPLVTTTYTLTGTTGGCSSTATVTVTVDPTCCPGTFVVPPAGTTSSVFGTSFAATTIALNGNWTIDVNTFISNNTIVYCAPNTKIIIPTGKILTINKSSLYSCGLQMWDGIEIQPGGNLIITNKSLIEDAKIAVWSNNAGGVANFTIEKTTFNRNYIGVKVENYSGPLHPGRIRSSTFGSAASFTSTPNTAFLDAPFNSQTAEKGVYLFNVNSIQIGDPLTPLYQNDFIYLRIGIHAEASVYTAYNNSFHNGYLATLCVSCPTVGWAIWNNRTKAVIGGAAANQLNKFKDITNGILHENGTSLDAFYNTFENMIYSFPYSGGTAIFTRNFTQAGVIRIAFNDIKNVKTGLHHQNNFTTSYTAQGNLFKNFNARGIYCVQNSYGNIGIVTNDFNLSPSSVYTGNIGIEISNAVVGLGASPVVKVNSNTIYRMNKGILLNTLSKTPEVKNNNIAFKSTIVPSGPAFYYGIRSLNCEGELIFQNTVSKGGANPTSTFEFGVYGITVENNQTNVSVLENNTVKVGTGLRFRGYSNASSKIRCNIMNRNFSGIGLESVDIGNQGLPAVGAFPGDAADNSWTNPSSVSGSVSVRGSGLTTFYSFYTRSAAYPWCPSAVSINPALSILTATNSGPTYLTPGALTNCSNLCGTLPYPPCVHSPSLGKIARNEAPFDAITGTKRYLMHEGLLRGVLSDSIPPDTTTIDGLDIQTFINDALINTNMGKLVNVGILYGDGDTTGAMALNASVATTRCEEEYHKIVNGIFFNTWGIGNFYISPPDSLTLYNIAIQDPLDCGSAIYDARVMLGIDINDYTEPGHMMQNFEEQGTAVEDKIGVLYPNPAHGSCTYEAALTETQSGFIMIYDLNGKLLQSYKLNSGDNKVEMDLSVYSNGVYMYQIVINGETIEHKKLVISK